MTNDIDCKAEVASDGPMSVAGGGTSPRSESVCSGSGTSDRVADQSRSKTAQEEDPRGVRHAARDAIGDDEYLGATARVLERVLSNLRRLSKLQSEYRCQRN